jgi:hypothetical protein
MLGTVNITLCVSNPGLSGGKSWRGRQLAAHLSLSAGALYIYIYMCVCVCARACVCLCVCVCVCVCVCRNVNSFRIYGAAYFLSCPRPGVNYVEQRYVARGGGGCNSQPVSLILRTPDHCLAADWPVLIRWVSSTVPQPMYEVYASRNPTTHLHVNLCKAAFKYANRVSLRKIIKLHQLVSVPELKSSLINTNQPPSRHSFHFRSQMTIIICAKWCFPYICSCYRYVRRSLMDENECTLCVNNTRTLLEIN